MKSPLSWLPLASGGFVLVLAMAVSVLTVTGGNNSNLATTQNVTTQAAETTATLSLSPSTGEYTLSKGISYPLGIVINSGEKIVDGVDIIINFDPTRVQVDSPKVVSTNIFEETPQNIIDNKLGKIKFSALTFNSRSVAGIVGTFRIKPLVKGEITLGFAFTPGATTDSNIAEHATAYDILGKVENATFIFK